MSPVTLRASSPFSSGESRALPRYKNEFRWRVMPPDQAVEQGYYSRSFPNKKKAVAYQRLIKTLFPGEPCCLCDTGKYYDAHGHIFHSKEGR